VRDGERQGPIQRQFAGARKPMSPALPRNAIFMGLWRPSLVLRWSRGPRLADRARICGSRGRVGDAFRMVRAWLRVAGPRRRTLVRALTLAGRERRDLSPKCILDQAGIIGCQSIF